MNGVALIGGVFVVWIVVWIGAGLLVARLFRINRQDKDNES